MRSPEEVIVERIHFVEPRVGEVGILLVHARSVAEILRILKPGLSYYLVAKSVFLLCRCYLMPADSFTLHIACLW
jgi:hypothetical protein